MKSTVIWSLVGLNLLLAAIVVARNVPISSAHAQVNRPNDYLMIPGKTTGLSYSVVYIIDTSDGKLSAIGYDDSRKRIETMPALELARFFNPGGAAPGGTAPKTGGGGYR